MRLVKKNLLIGLAAASCLTVNAQKGECTFQPPFYSIHFGRGNVRELANAEPTGYVRVSGSCPNDGYYSYISNSDNCFNGDWHTLSEDHTPGDESGNMMLVNASYTTGAFLSTTVSGFKPGAVYELSVWMMNVCRPTDKCPSPLLPDITIRLQTLKGQSVAQLSTGELRRKQTPEWTQYKAVFTVPKAETSFRLVMTNHTPGGCGNDFALDDISFRECVKPPPVVNTIKKDAVKPKTPAPGKVNKKPTPAPVRREQQPVSLPKKEITKGAPEIKKPSGVLPKPPPVLTNRTNILIRQIDTKAGEIRIDLYDNGEIDGDTVSIYHNNTLLVSRTRLSQKPITFRITVNKDQPHHELIMVAENLGTIPPNTSLMIVTAGDTRHQVFISSSEQKNAQVVFNLKE